MSIEDKNKWDKKYNQVPNLLEPREASLFVKKYASVGGGSKVLDLACGVGRNTIYLAHRGFSVDAIDISKEALDTLNSRINYGVKTIEADLDDYSFKDRYNLIIKCNYLDRDLIERTKSSLESGGVYIVETYIDDKDNEKKVSNPDFLLKKGELKEIFKDGFEILEYNEFTNESFESYKMKKAAIAARKI